MFDIDNIKTKTVHMEHRLVQKAVSKEATALSLQQKKLLFFLISNIEPADASFKKTVISIPDYFRLTGVAEGGADRKNLRKEIQSFADKSFWIDTEDMSVLYRWVNTAVIDNKKNTITLELHETIKDFLLGLDQKSRAIFQLGYALSFRHKYSPDLYAFAASIKDLMIKNKTMYKMPVDEALKKFGNGKYSKFTHWKKYILEPSLKEINEKTDLNLYVEFLKTDKTYKTKVTYILFGVTRKVGADLAKVRVDALNVNHDKTVQEEAEAYADGYIEEYTVEKLGFDPLGYNAEDVLDAIEAYESKAKYRRES